MEEAGTPKRVHYEVLGLIDDFAADPEVERIPFAIFPFRLHWDEDNYRHTGWYRDAVDIDYGLLHEEGHQLGLIDMYVLNMPGDRNQVNGVGYGAPTCLMNACSDVLSAHSAGAMTHWYETAHGYFGQYLYGLPATVRLRLTGNGSQPLAGATVTVFQRIEQPDGQIVITNQVRALLTADDDGLVTLPNVPVDPALVPPLPNGDALQPNPFGYVDMLGTNGLFLIKVEHQGFTDWCWLDITEVNLAYWSGQAAEATISRNLNLGGDIQIVPLSDLAEPSAGSWDAWAESATASVVWDSSRRIFGPNALAFETDGGFDTLVRYPGDKLVRWDLSASTALRFWIYAENPNWGFQGNVPWVRLGCPDGSHFTFAPAGGTPLNLARDQWYEYVIPLTGDAAWTRTIHGSPSLAAISSLEIHMDTWEYGFSAWIDGVRFEPVVASDATLPVAPSVTALGQNVPNPFNPATTIRYSLDREGAVSLLVFNARGERVRRLFAGHQSAGAHAIEWDGSDDAGRSVSAGAYFCTLESQGRRMTRKLMLVR